MKKKSLKRLSLGQKAKKALEEAVQDVIKENEEAGLPLIVWKDKKVVKIPPEKLKKIAS